MNFLDVIAISSRKFRHCSWLFLAVLVSACSSTPKFQLQQDILAAGLSPDDVSVLMLPLSVNTDGNADELSFAADRPMQPASTMKLLTTSVALDLLGNNWRGETQLLVQKTDLDRQTLSGPLIVQGRSNTDLSYGELNFMLQQLYDQGVRHIPAGLQFDRESFSPNRPSPTAEPFDEAPRARYNHVPDPLMLQQNMHWLSLQSAAKGVKGWFSPGWPALQLDLSALKLVDVACDTFSIHRQQIVVQQRSTEQLSQEQSLQEQRQLKIVGEFPANCQWQGQLELLDRDLNLQLAVQTYWRQLGGTMGNSVIFKQADADSQLLVQHLGRPLPEIVSRINKFSDNALARLLYANLAEPVDTNPTPSTSHTTQQLADQRVHHWFKQHNISTAGLVIDNGSGLSRSAQISARQLAGLLDASWLSRYSAEFVASLPLAGVDGTLLQRLKNGPAWQRARLKTGTLRDVTALAGYVWDSQNRPWIFVGFVNAAHASAKGRPLLDKWVQQLAGQ
ncbi:D-alanyl-D-alanine carboxypeptidase/D-alanyl-D-alanine-endopeptidase [Rheinheimera riviphila]|nr:D-alanyl-D-alanine carboxypeptidase/D-alanyl-D-alanine-endopeptidase [Rheinheimera riviphila]